MSVNVGTAMGYLDLDTSKFKTGLRSALSDLKAFTNDASTSKDKLSAFSSAATSAGRSLTKGLTVPLAGIGTAAVAVTAKFDQGMSQVQAISGATGDELESLRNKAKEMGAQTKFSANESAEAFNYMAMAGWKTEDMLGGIEGVMNLAAASGESLGTVSDIVTDAMTAFGMSASETSKVLKDGMEVEVPNTTRFVDALAAASNSSNTNVAMLGESFKYVAPIAGSLGYSVEDTAIALGLMANNGIKASSAGTALRNILTNMANPTESMAAAMDTLGVSLEDSEGNVKPLMDVMKDLRKGFGGGQVDAEEFSKAMEGLQNDLDSGKITQEAYNKSIEGWTQKMYGAEGAQKAQLAASLAGKFGMAGLLAIVNTTEEDFNSLSDAIYNASGTSKEMADIMLDNLPGAITLAKSALQGLAIHVVEGDLMSGLTKLVKKFTEFITWLDKADDKTIKFAVVMGTILAAIGPVLLMLGTMTRQILTLMEAYEKLNKLLAGKTVKNFLLAAKAKLADAAATTKDAIANSGLARSMRGLLAPVKTAIGRILALAAAHKAASLAALGVVGGLVGLIIYMKKSGTSVADLKKKLSTMFDKAISEAPKLANSISKVLIEVLRKLPQTMSTVLSTIGDIVTSGLKTLRKALPKLAKWWAKDMPKLISVGSDMIVNIIDGFSKSLPALIDTASNMLVQIIDQFFDRAPQFIEAGIQIVSALILGFTQAVPKLIDSLMSILDTNLTPIINAISKAAMTIGQMLIKNLPIFINATVKIITAIAQTLAKAAPKIIATAVKLAAALASGLLKALPQIIVAVGKITLALIKAFLKITAELVKAGVKILQAVWRGIKSWAGKLVSNVISVAKRLPQAIKTGIGNLLNAGKTWIVGLWNGIKSKFEDIKSKVTTFAKDLPKRIVKGLGSLFDVGVNWIKGLINGFNHKKQEAVNTITKGAKEIGKAAEEALEINSPSRWAYRIGGYFMQGLENGIEYGIKPVLKTMYSGVESIKDAFSPLQNYNFEIGESLDKRLLGSLDGLSMNMNSKEPPTIVNNITIDGAQNPEDFAHRLTRQLKIDMRTI